MSSSNCCFLTCVQVSQETDKVVWYSHIFRNFQQFIVIHTVKGFGVVEAEVGVFLEFLYFHYDPTYVGHLFSGSFAFSKSSLYLCKFLVHVLLKPSLKDFEDLANMWSERSCTVIWTFFIIWTFLGLVLLWDWNENWPFPVLWPLLSFPNFLTYWVHHWHFNSIIFQDLK